MKRLPQVTLASVHGGRSTFNLVGWRDGRAYVVNDAAAPYLIDVTTGVATGIEGCNGQTLYASTSVRARLKRLRNATSKPPVVLFDRTYHGFESLNDYFSDVHEAVDADLNPTMKDVPGEFQGKVRVTVTYEEDEGETT